MRSLFRIRLLSLMAALFLFGSCMTYEDVEFRKVQSVNFNRTGGDVLLITLGVDLFNPNGYKIKVVKSDLELMIGGTPAGKAQLKKKVVIQKRKEGTYDVIIEADQKAISKAILSAGIGALFSGKVQIGVKGWVKGRVFIFGKKFDVDFKQSVDTKDLKMG